MKAATTRATPLRTADFKAFLPLLSSHGHPRRRGGRNQWHNCWNGGMGTREVLWVCLKRHTIKIWACVLELWWSIERRASLHLMLLQPGSQKEHTQTWNQLEPRSCSANMPPEGAIPTNTCKSMGKKKNCLFLVVVSFRVVCYRALLWAFFRYLTQIQR